MLVSFDEDEAGLDADIPLVTIAFAAIRKRLDGCGGVEIETKGGEA